MVTPPNCELCRRQIAELTKHHLIPRMRHRNRRTQKQFKRQEMVERILWLCQPCHNHIHRVLSEKALADHYNTREALLAHDEIQRFVAWIKVKPAGFKPKA